MKKIEAGFTAPDFAIRTPWGDEGTLYELLDHEDVLILFLRYMGCPICRMKMSELARDAADFENAGVRVLVFLQSEPGVVAKELQRDTTPFIPVCDPGGETYSLYSVEPGSVFRYITPGVIKKAIRATRMGINHGKKEGNELQLPAMFLVSGRKIVHAYYGKNIGDLPGNNEIIALVHDFRKKQ